MPVINKTKNSIKSLQREIQRYKEKETWTGKEIKEFWAKYLLWKKLSDE
jgi:uncharacterized protein YukE